MSVTPYPRSRSLRMGPQTHDFMGADRAAAEASRDSYFSSNPSNLAVYDGNSDLLVRLIYTDVELTSSFMQRIAGQWVDITPVVQGPNGEVVSLAGVPIGEIPFKKLDGTFGGSNMRVLDDGRVLAPPGFTVESGSVTFGEAITLSEISGFLGISNHLNGREYTVVDFYTPPDAASAPPSIFHLIEPAFEFVAQAVDTTNIPDNPLSFNYIVQNTARSRALKFRTYAAMTNVRIKITIVSSDVVLKYIPNQQSWEEETAGLSWILGDNAYEFGDTSLNLQAGQTLHFEIKADAVALKGNVTGIPYFTAMIQRGEFRDVIMDNVYVASDIKAKLETLLSPNKLSKSAIQDVVNTVNGGFGDVSITTGSIGAQPVDATLTALAAQVTAANGLTYSTGVDTFAQTVLTPFARTLIDDTSDAQARATLNLGDMALQNAVNVSITGGSVTGITDLAIADGGTGASTAANARTNLGIIPGTYTPTITNISNIQAVTAAVCMYSQVGNMVTVNGRVNIDPTTNGSATAIEMTLPVASNFVAIGNLIGISSCGQTTQSGALSANTTSDRALMEFQAGSNAARDHVFTYTYLVL